MLATRKEIIRDLRNEFVFPVGAALTGLFNLAPAFSARDFCLQLAFFQHYKIDFRSTVHQVNRTVSNSYCSIDCK
jgi:hypothetical protein